MLNVFILEGRIKRIRKNEDSSLLVLLEVERNEINLNLDNIQVLITGRMVQLFKENCDYEDVISVQGHIKEIDKAFILVVDKLSYLA